MATVKTSKVIEHALLRCGFPIEKQTPYLVDIAKDNLFFLFSAFGARGLPLWCVEEVEIDLTDDTARYSCPSGTYDVLMLNLRTTVGSTYTDRVLTKISRDQYFLLPNKETSGTPTQFWFDRQITPAVVLWPVPASTTGLTLRLVRQKQITDPGALTAELEIPSRFLEPTIWQLALRMCMSIPNIDPNVKGIIVQQAEQNTMMIEADDVDGAPFMLSVEIGAYNS